MGYYLLDHKPARSQFVLPRREPNSGEVMVHCSDGPMDRNRPDTGPENLAGFIVGRSDPGSYTIIAGADSVVCMLPDNAEAFGALGGWNRHVIHICFPGRPGDFHPDDPQTVDALRNGAVEIVAYWRRQGLDPLQARWARPGEPRGTGPILRHHGDVQSDRSDAWARSPERQALDAMLLAEIFVAAGGFQQSEEDDMALPPQVIATGTLGGKGCKLIMLEGDITAKLLDGAQYERAKFFQLRELPGTLDEPWTRMLLGR